MTIFYPKLGSGAKASHEKPSQTGHCDYDNFELVISCESLWVHW